MPELCVTTAFHNVIVPVSSFLFFSKAVGYWWTAKIPKHVGTLLQRSNCNCVSESVSPETESEEREKADKLTCSFSMVGTWWMLLTTRRLTHPGTSCKVS